MKKPQIKKIPKYCISGLQQQNHSEHGLEVPVRLREYKNKICKGVDSPLKTIMEVIDQAVQAGTQKLTNQEIEIFFMD